MSTPMNPPEDAKYIDIPECKPIPAPEPRDPYDHEWWDLFEMRITVPPDAKPMMVGRTIKTKSIRRLYDYHSTDIYYVYKCTPVDGEPGSYDLVVRPWTTPTVDYDLSHR